MIKNSIYFKDLYVHELMDIVGGQDNYTFDDVMDIALKSYILGSEKHIKEFYTLEQISNELDFNVRALRDFIKNGKLKAHKVGTRYICTREEINNWINNQE